MIGWHHQLNRHEFEKALGDGEGQETLAMLQSMGSQTVGNISATELNSVEKLLNGYSPDIERILKIMRGDEFGF